MDAEVRLGEALANGVLPDPGSSSGFSPLGPHVPLQLTVLGSAPGDLGPKVRGPAGLPSFAVGAWSMEWGRLGVSMGSWLAWTGGQMRVRGAGSCWWPWRTWHRLQSKWVRVSPYRRRGQRPVQPASSRAECSLPGPPPHRPALVPAPSDRCPHTAPLGSQVLGPHPYAALPEADHLLPGCLSFPTCTVGEHVL